MDSPIRDEDGVTLIELMAALMILSLVVLAVLALLATLVKSSALANEQTEAEALAIAAADYVKGDGFDYDDTPGGCIAFYNTSLADYVGFETPPAGFNFTIDSVAWGDAATVTGGEFNAENWTPYVGTAFCLTDGDPSPKAVKVAVKVASTDGRVSRTREVVMRCDRISADHVGKEC